MITGFWLCSYKLCLVVSHDHVWILYLLRDLDTSATLTRTSRHAAHDNTHNNWSNSIILFLWLREARIIMDIETQLISQPCHPFKNAVTNQWQFSPTLTFSFLVVSAALPPCSYLLSPLVEPCRVQSLGVARIRGLPGHMPPALTSKKRLKVKFLSKHQKCLNMGRRDSQKGLDVRAELNRWSESSCLCGKNQKRYF